MMLEFGTMHHELLRTNLYRQIDSIMMYSLFPFRKFIG